MGFFSWWAKNISLPSRELPEHLEPPTPPTVPPHHRRHEIPRMLGTAQLLSGSARPFPLLAHALDTAGVDNPRVPLMVAAYLGGETWTNVIIVLADGSLWPVDSGLIRICGGWQCEIHGCTVKAQIDSDLTLTKEMFRQ